MNQRINHSRFRHRLLRLMLVLVGTTIHYSFAIQYKFKHFSISDGLPSNSIRCITQDHRGFIWIGTESGLCRFDGMNFKIFKNNPTDSTSIGSNYINSIFEDSRKNCWLGTDRGVYMYNPEWEVFSLFTPCTEEEVQITSGITHIQEDNQGYIWFSTEGQGVFCFDRKGNRLQQFKFSSTHSNDTANLNFVYSLFIDSRQNIWASTRASDSSLFLFDKESNTFRYYPIKSKVKSIIYCINEDAQGYLWLGTWEDGLYRLNLLSGEIKTYLSPQKKEGISHIHSILPYQPDILLVGSDDGLLEFTISTEKYRLMTASELQVDGLSDKFIYPIYKDREGGLWVGSYYKGVNYAAPDRGYIENFTHSEYKNSVCGNIISCFCEDSSGNMWIGSDDGGLSYFDTRKKTFKNYRPVAERNSLSYHNIHALLIADGKLWIGTYAGGLNVMDLATERFKLYLPEEDNPRSIDGNSVYSIFKDNLGNVWIGSMHGINRYNKETDDFTRIRSIGTTTLDITQDKDGTLWFATWGGGLYRYAPQTQEWKHYTSDSSDNSALPHNTVYSLCMDSNDRLWLGTDNGLCYYDKEQAVFIREPLAIPNLSIVNIISHNSILWLSTSNGLVRFDPETKNTKVFTTNDGLQNNHCTIKGSRLSSDKKIYLGTTHGFTILCPQTLKSNTYIPPIVITNFQLFNKDMRVRVDKVLPKAIDFADELTLTHKQNVFNIEYAALSYSAPSQNEYKYILEGFDKDWNYVKNQQKATYTNLPAGKYTFRVTGTNNDGVWNEAETNLVIRVLPPFWRSIWAYLVYAALIVGAIFYTIYFIRKRTDQKNRIRIKKLNDEKEKELYNAKINFFTQVAHEIRTPVSLIIGPLEKILEQSEQFGQTILKELTIINRNSQRLLTLVNQLLDFRKAEQGGFTPCFSPQHIYTLSQNIYDRFNPLIVKKGITFEFIMEQRDLMAVIDAEAYTKIVSNLLTNAVKHAQTKISMTITQNDTCFILNITDDGEGIEEQEQKHIFKPFYQIAGNNKSGTGLGLSLVKLLTDAHRGMIDVTSIPGQTSFTATFPLTQESVSDYKQEVRALTEINDFSFLLEEETNEVPSEMDPGQPTLLIVEDNIDLCNFLGNEFSQTYNVVIAHNGQEGLERLSQQAIDLIISDIMMPVMDGIVFCKEVKSNYLYSHIPLILLTAKIESTVRVESVRTGADAYIEKPFSMQLLRAQIENLLNSRQLLKKKFSEMPFMKLDSIAGNKADELFLSKLNSIIEENISNADFSIDILAEQLCISRSGLFSKIKMLTDMTPNELIHLVRLKKAAELLSTKEYRINEICYLVGFNNPSYFSKCFQKQFGVLPKDFITKKI